MFLVDYEAIMEERKRIADEEERKRKEYELKVNSILEYQIWSTFKKIWHYSDTMDFSQNNSWYNYSDLQCNCYSSILPIL